MAKAKLSKKEFAEMKKRAIAQLRNIVTGYTIEPYMEDGCLHLCRGYEQIEVFSGVPEVIEGESVRVTKITVRGNGTICLNICQQDTEWLINNINVLERLVQEIMRAKGKVDKEKIREVYFILKNIEIFLDQLSPFIDS